MKKIIFMGCIVLLTGCSANTSDPNQFSQQSNESGEVTESVRTDGTQTTKVVASFYPLAYIAQRIGADTVEVQNIVGAADPHEYALSPRDIEAFQSADVVLLQGAGFEPWGADIAGQLEDAGTVTIITDGLDLRENEEGHSEHSEVAGDEHDDHHNEEYSEHDEHDHGSLDPHTWLDPVIASQMADQILQILSGTDPTNSDLFDTNANELKEEFASLDSSYEQGLANCTREDVIISHDSFGYLADRYNFSLHPIAGLSTQDEPSAKVLADLKQEAEEGITHILTDQTAVDRFAQTLAAETGLEMLTINTLASPSEDGADFFTRAKDNLTQIQTALGCKSTTPM